jgi:hypothetical protein
MLISKLLVAVKIRQPTSIDIYNSKEVENNIYYESSYIISCRISPFNVETNAFNALLGIGRARFVDADQVQLWKTST